MTAWVMVAMRSSRRVAMSCSCLAISASILAVSWSRKFDDQPLLSGSGQRQFQTTDVVEA